MTDPSSPSMHEDPTRPAAPVPAQDEPSPPAAPQPARSQPGALARLVALIVSVGLAWALTVAITAWILGLFLTRG